MEPVSIGAYAICDGETGNWAVYWKLMSLFGRVTLTALTDPVNGLAVSTLEGQDIAPIWRPIEAQEFAPGSATVAALALTLTLSDGSSQVENRTVQLGDPCTVQPEQACDSSAPQLQVSAAGSQATVNVLGPCQFTLEATITDAHHRGLHYSAVSGPYSSPSVTRQVIAADLPPCQWVAVLTPDDQTGPTYYSGGSGPCTDDNVTVVEQCRNRFVLTLSNGADAALPTTFGIVPGPGGFYDIKDYRQLAPGQSVTIDLGVETRFMSVWYWGTLFGEWTWELPRDGRCSEISSPAVPPGGLSSPVPIGGN